MKRMIFIFMAIVILLSGCQISDPAGGESTQSAGNPSTTSNTAASTASNTGTGTTPADTASTGTEEVTDEPGETGTAGTTAANTKSGGSTTKTPGTNKPATNTTAPGKTSTGQTLKYWVNFPQKGSVTTLHSHSFTVKTIENGVSITAYNKDGSQNKSASVSSINTWLSSYEITDSKGSVVQKGSSKAVINNFTMNIYVSGACSTDKKAISFTGYYKDYKGSNAVVVYQDLSTSFTIKRGSSSWTYSSTYSAYPKSIMSVSNSTSTQSVSVKLKKGNTVYRDDFESSQFVYTPNNTVNNGLPTILINVDNSDDYYDLTSNSDRALNDKWLNATYAVVEGTNKVYNTKAQHGTAQIKRRGFSSFDMPKKPYSFKLNDKQSLTNMKANKDWVLVANYADKSLLRNYFAYTIGKKMNRAFVPECRSVEVYLGRNGSSTYLGTYLLVEKLEVAKDKINITEMTEKDTSINTVRTSDSDSKILAGSFLAEIETFDRFGSEDTGIYTSAFPLNIKSPGKSIFQPSYYSPTKNTNLSNYIESFFDVVDYHISQSANNNNVFKYIDMNSFVDYYIINELAKNIDGNLRLSTYFYKDKGGKMYITIWDFDIAFGNCDYEFNGVYCGEYTGFHMAPNATWYRRLFRNSTFKNAVKTRWTELRKSGGILSDANITSVINTEASKITKSAEANFKEWPILGMYVWPNSHEIVGLNTYKKNTDHLISWIKNRASWLDKNMPPST